MEVCPFVSVAAEERYAPLVSMTVPLGSTDPDPVTVTLTGSATLSATELLLGFTATAGVISDGVLPPGGGEPDADEEPHPVELTLSARTTTNATRVLFQRR
jgi:hypothetical protein